MSTDYYLVEEPPCGCCGRPYPELEVGTRAGGWGFTLGALGETWPAIRERILSAWRVRDEYSETLFPAEMVALIESWGSAGRSMAAEYPETYFRCPVSGFSIRKP